MSTIKATTLSNLAGSQTVPMDTVAQGSAKAWVNFNGTGTVAIRRAFNVSSITDNGVGDYTVNFTNAMVDANYETIGATGGHVTSGFGAIRLESQTASASRVASIYSGGTQDASNISVSIFS